MQLHYSPHFTRAYKNLPEHIKQSFNRRIAVFVQNPEDPSLRTHKLKGRLRSAYAFRLVRGFRVIFDWVTADEVNLLDVGSHDLYRLW